MAIELLYQAMDEVLQARQATPEQRSAYSVKFGEAAWSAGTALPCPLCFLEGVHARLRPLPKPNGPRRTVCVDRCHTEFSWKARDAGRN
ncbi:MAG: hypothetical protein JWN73_999 [Betaproteobacteria bacterium]|nr:hypothetical protein [Betaproteobacteria bacterium]